MRCQVQLSLIVVFAALIAVDAGILPIEESFVATGNIIQINVSIASVVSTCNNSNVVLYATIR